MCKPRLYVDFNEMLEPDLVLLSAGDMKTDSSGTEIHLHQGLSVDIYTDDIDDQGHPDPLIASGVVEANADRGWSRRAKWCCRIDEAGIRHLSDPPD